MRPTFSQKIKNEKTGDVYLIKGRDHTGQMAFYYLKLDQVKAPIFRKEINNSSSINLADYGTVLESGYGVHIPDEIKNKFQ